MVELLFRTNNPQKSSVIWNSATGIINALQSVILLMIITRVNGIYDAGVFSISYAVAILALMIGSFSMRSFQATDISEGFTYGEYCGSRIYTCILMVLFSFGYCIYGFYIVGYSFEKASVVFFTCIWKMIDASEDIIHGNLQQKGRLDVAAKAAFIRMVVGVIVYSICLVVSHSLIVATVCCCIASGIVFFLFTIPAGRKIEIAKVRLRTSIIGHLLLVTLPLCATGFFSTYIANAPKYAIDFFLTDGIQAKYNYIFMPVFFVNLLATFALNPVLTELAQAKKERNKKQFNKTIKQLLIFVLMTDIVAIIVGLTIGLPILSLIFSVTLDRCRMPLCILLIGGGFFAVVTILTNVVVVLRKQKIIIFGYVGAAIMSKLVAGVCVKSYGMMGAAAIYTSAMFLLAIYCMVIVVIETRKCF